MKLTTLVLALSGTVTHIVDGDTFDIGTTRIRLCGIGAPEKGSYSAIQSKGYLDSLISGKRVQCAPVGQGSVCDGRSKPTNRGRIVAQCFLGDLDIAGEMVREGHACDWVRFSGGAYPGGCTR